MSTQSASLSPVRRQEIITRFLAWLYGEESLFRSPSGLAYPLNVQSWADQPRPLAALLGDLTIDSRTFPSSSWLLEDLRSNHKHLWNGTTYALADRSRMPSNAAHQPQADGERLHCVVGTYFDTVNTCTILEAELQRAVCDCRLDVVPEQLYQALPQRHHLHADRLGQAALADAWSGRDRSAAVSISCCFVVNSGSTDDDLVAGQQRYFLCQRSEQVADGPGLSHIVPSMVFQPSHENPFDPQSYCLERIILREVGEELFDREEGDQDALLYPEIADLNTLLASGGATLLVTGVAMDLLCLRPEILALCWIRDGSWYARYGSAMKLSRHEYNPVSMARHSWRAILDDEPFCADGEFAPHRCIATGAASAILARQYLCRELYAQQ